MGLDSLHMRRLLRLAIVLGAIAVALAGCGDDGQSSTSESSGVTTDPAAAAKAIEAAEDGDKQADGPELMGDVEQARAGAKAVDEVYDDFAAAVDDGVASPDAQVRDTLDAAADDERLASICDLMSEQAKQQTIVYAKRSAGLGDVEWTCENATALLLRRARQAGGVKRSLQAEIVGVNVEGDRATASIRFGGKGPITAIPMVKEDGSWKLAASPSGGGGE
jgi:hypothetical protein